MTGTTGGLAALGDRVRAEQDAQLEAEYSLGAVRVEFLSSIRRPRPKHLLRSAWFFAAALGVALSAFGVVWRLLPEPLAVTAGGDRHPIHVGDWIDARSSAIALNFSDGTRITLDPGSRARLEAVDAAGARLAIETGHADAQVVPGRNGRWHLSLGPFGVDVTGTEFDVGWNPEAEELGLSMREGKVIVSGCVLGDGRPLVAGERLTASCRERRFEVMRGKSISSDSTAQNIESAEHQAPIGSAASALETRRPDGAASAIPRSDAPFAPDSWQALARAGKYQAALIAANDSGFDQEVSRSSAEDLSLLADIARFGGNIDGSIRAYLSLRHRFPRSPLAANAAFAIGRMEFDQRGAFVEAERWFANYLAEQPRGPLAREALGRRMEALDRAGSSDAARGVALSYQKSYPRGPHIHLAERLLNSTN